jgi:hypothetical protein
LARVAIEVGLRQQHAAEHERGVDRRQFGRTEAMAGVHVEKVIVEPFVTGLAGFLRPLGQIGEKA